MRSISFRGVTIGGPNSPYRILSVEGVDDFESDTAVVGTNRIHGGYVAGGYAAARDLTVTFRLRDRDVAAVHRLRQLKRAFAPSGDVEYRATVTYWDGSQLQGFARCAARSVPATLENLEYREGTVRLVFADPRLYSAYEYGTSLDLTAATAPGTSWADFAFGSPWPGAPIGEKEVTAVNGGTFATWPKLTLLAAPGGALVSPIVYHLDTGEKLDFSADGGLSIPAGSSLVVDSNPTRRTVQLADGTNRWNTLAIGSRFFPLRPGDNRLRMLASGVTTGARLLVSWRHAEL